MSKEKVIKLAKKLKALAERGVEGERDSAREKLSSLLKEHSLDEHLLVEGLRIFERTTLNEGSVILERIIKSVSPESKITVRQHKTQLMIEVVLSDIEYKEVRQKYKFFWRGYNRLRKLLLTAYFNKHYAYFNPAPDVAKSNSPSSNASPTGSPNSAHKQSAVAPKSPPSSSQRPQQSSSGYTPPASSSFTASAADDGKGRPLTFDETKKVRAMMYAMDNMDYRKIFEMQDSDSPSDNEYKSTT